MILAERLTCGYQDKIILKDVSISLAQGSFTTLLGPNGAGKSTLLYALMGFLKLKSGRIAIQNRELDQITRAELAKMVAYIPQELHSEFEYSVQDTVLMGRFPFMGLLQKYEETDLLLVHETLERLALYPLRDRFLHQLSGGEKQRVFIARALVQETPFILLDESLSQLDINYQLDTMRLLRKICTDQSKGILLISHNLNLSANFSDIMIFVKDGSILAQGKPHELMREDILYRLFGVPLQTSLNPLSNTNNIVYPG